MDYKFTCKVLNYKAYKINIGEILQDLGEEFLDLTSK